MTDTQEYFEAFDAQAQRRAGRRAFFKAAVVAGATAASAGSFLVSSPAAAQAVTDADVLNFALNLEYLEANFYYYAAFGQPIPTSSIGGAKAIPATPTTSASGVVYNANARAVRFSDPIIAQYAVEIAAEELAHVNFLRSALMSAAVDQPQLDVGTDPKGAFSTVAQAAGVVAAGQVFDPYSSDINFLFGAYIFEDVGVTAYHGGSSLLTNKTYLDAAAGILAAEAYHAAIVRTTLDQLGIQTPAARTTADKISALRDSLDGNTTSAGPPQLYANDDRGLSHLTSNALGSGDTALIAPVDANGLAFGRTTGQVLNIVYGTKAQATMGGFFPAGMNGNIKTSTNNS